MGWLPGSSVLLTGADLVTVKLVADAFGVQDYWLEQAVGSAGKGFIGKKFAYELLTLIPGPGWAIKSAAATAMTAASGSALIEYMESRSPYV
ncbi:hypothetical protein Aph02nite_78320 [Actinoplanes philippinensis]|nr:hypothetical protein Aph02nite_78320 [Actinoplanes philippinensis]